MQVGGTVFTVLWDVVSYRMALSKDQNKKLSIIMVGQYVPTSGLTCVLQSLMTHLKNTCDISVIGLGYQGSPFDDGAKIYPDLLSGRKSDCPNQDFEALFEIVKPDIIFLFNEISIQASYLKQLQASTINCKIVVYTAMESVLVQNNLLSELSSADHCVFFSEFARNQAEKYISSSRLSVIPVGVDPDVFYPYPGSIEAQPQRDGRKNARRILFPEQPDLLDAFIVLNANQPWQRKRIDLTIQGFSLFAQNKPAKVKLFLHHARTNERERARILRMAKQWRIIDRLILNPIVDGKSKVSVEQLNLLYNACDVGINTAMGEGWGLVNFEHAATGAAQIVPKHGTCAEIWEGAADFLEPVDQDVFLFAPHYRLQTVAAEDVAAKLENLYNEPEYKHRMSIAAYQRVTLPQYHWANIAKQWETVFNLVMES